VLILLLSSYFTLDKSEALSRYTSGRSYIANRQIPKGIDQLRRAIDTGGDAIDRRDAHTRLVAVALDSTAIAASILQKARGDFPEDIRFALAEQVFHSVGSDSIRQRQAQLSLESNRGQNEGNDRWIAHLYANIGDGYFTRRDWTRAIHAREDALRFDAKRQETRLLLGWTYFMTNRFTDAIATYRTVLTQGPDSEAYFNIGLAHMALGDTATATKIYADGIAQWGREQAETARARSNLERLISFGIQTGTARDLILRHFPD
jgi:tetratricopeptide (TPR) repeat protein